MTIDTCDDRTADGDVLLILRPLRDDVPAATRPRRAFKALLRTYRIRCRTIRPARPSDT